MSSESSMDLEAMLVEAAAAPDPVEAAATTAAPDPVVEAILAAVVTTLAAVVAQINDCRLIVESWLKLLPPNDRHTDVRNSVEKLLLDLVVEYANATDMQSRLSSGSMIPSATDRIRKLQDDVAALMVIFAELKEVVAPMTKKRNHEETIDEEDGEASSSSTRPRT